MDRDRLKEIFEEARHWPAASREDRLREACAGDEELLGELRSLLEAADSAPSLFDTPAFEAWTDLGAAEDEGLAPGVRAGRWILEEAIGRGGMGTVWKARSETEPGASPVAVKFVRRGMSTASVLRRFARERETLATLDHPNIARLLDAGATDDGRPFLVMEYVDGRPVDLWCREHGAAKDQVLRLFLDVCAGVHHAHQNLVVHRDLKPGNILVTPDGVPKLVDFGIAKILDPTGAGVLTTLTRMGSAPLTPDYASPEQVRGEFVTTASDIWSLGVVLYLLLTGRKPFQVETASRADAERILAEQEPLRPSLAARQAGDDALGRRLRGDLDNIVLKTLRKDPLRRYTSPAELAADLQRHLDGLPVLARGESLGYLLATFVRRHRRAVAAAAAVFAVAVGSAIFNYAQWRKADRAWESSQDAWSTTRQANDFLQWMLLAAAPGEAGDKDLRVVDLLDRGAARLRVQFQDEPATLADLERLMGAVYSSLGEYGKAEQLLEPALAGARQLYGEENLHVAQVLHDLGHLRYLEGRYAESETLLRHSLELRRSLLEPDHPDVATSLTFLAMVLRATGRLEEAETALLQAAAIQERNGHGVDAHIANNLGNVYHDLDRLQDAEREFQRAVDLDRATYTGPHPDLARNLKNLATVRLALDKVDEAEAELHEALEIERKVLAPDHPELAVTLNNLAGVQASRGEFGGAAALLREAEEIYLRRLGPGHPNVIACRINLAWSLGRAKRPQEALEVLSGVTPVLAADPAQSERLAAVRGLQEQLEAELLAGADEAEDG